MADSVLLSTCIGEFVADDIDMAMAAQQLMQLSGDDDGTRSTADDNNSSCGGGGKKRKRSEKVVTRKRNDDEVVILMMAPRRVRKYRSLHNLYRLTKPISNASNIARNDTSSVSSWVVDYGQMTSNSNNVL